MWLQEVFGVQKPVIGMLHLDPLPGDVRFHSTDSIDQVVADAIMDIKALQEGGVDGVLISNEFSLPYEDKREPVNIAAMAYVIGCMKPYIRVPFGVDCIEDTLATIDIACATGAAFVREGFYGARVGLNGISNRNLSAALKRRKELGREDLKLLYFLNPESDYDLNGRPYDAQARNLIFNACPEGLCVSAGGTGQEVDDALLKLVKSASKETAVLCNTGCRPDNIAKKLAATDGAVVGTYFKENGAFQTEDMKNTRVKKERVEALMAEAKAFRAGL